MACKLHNFIIDRNEEQSEEDDVGVNDDLQQEEIPASQLNRVARGIDQQTAGSINVVPNYTDGTTLRRRHRSDLEKCATRERITAYLKNKGIFREQISLEQMVNGREKKRI